MIAVVGVVYKSIQKPDRIIVDMSSGRVVMINNRELGATEAVKLEKDKLQVADMDYVVKAFLDYLYHVDQASRSKDIEAALRLMVPGQAKKFAQYLSEQKILQMQREQQWNATWKAEHLEHLPGKALTVKVYGTQEIDMVVKDQSRHVSKHILLTVDLLPDAPEGGTFRLDRNLRSGFRVNALAARDLKALWAIGYDIALTNADTSSTEHALRCLDFVVVQDMFLNETARQFGNVFLPVASSFERDGTFMNAERRIQRIRKAIDPVGQSKPDWEIICALAKAMGKGQFFDYGSVEEIWNEVRLVWSAGRGITYKRLEDGGLQWPCPDEDHPGTEVMHSESFPLGKAALRRIPYRPTKEAVDEEFPFLLITGRTLYQFNAGTMTMRTPNAELRATDLLDVSVKDAERLRLHDGEKVRVRSRYGEATLPIRITSTVRPGELFATFHTTEVFLNRVTSPYRDRYVKSPEYKVTAVKIDKH